MQQALSWVMMLLLTWPAALPAQDTGQETAAQTYTYTQEQLDQLLAPIALYPDTLLSQILMASTYPLEVVEADRWLRQNPDLKGDMLDEALRSKPWDVSVKSLCHFPNILSMMDDKLRQTTDLGNAFLGQQDQVMDTIQKLRARAQAQGNLRSTDQQSVTVQDRDIIIEPVDPEVVYVPAYDPCWVYGSWWYPACSPLWFWWPGLVLGVGFYWGTGFFVGPVGLWCGFHWRRHTIFINTGRTVFMDKPGATRMHGGIETWAHNPVHRRGVAYHNPITAQRFGRAGVPGVDARRAFRGFPQEGRGPGQTVPGAVTRPGGFERPGTVPRMAPPGGVGSGRGFEPGGPGQPRQGFGGRSFEQPGTGFRSPTPVRPVQPRGGGAFEGLGRSGVQSQLNSERGRQSMGVNRSFQGGSLGGPSHPGGFGGGTAPPSGGFGGGAPRGGGFTGGGGHPGGGGGGGGHRGR